MSTIQRLAKSSDQIAGIYDVIVVGSGYGGAVAAARFAAAGLRVAVLERGREIPVGRFPETLDQARAEFRVAPDPALLAPEDALVQLRIGGDVHVVTGCGVGGTSLINANVAAQPEAWVLDDPRWPAVLRAPGALEPAYARAREMLRPAPLPRGESPRKHEALRAAAQYLGASVAPAEITVAMTPGESSGGVHQDACTRCGDCVTGCNVGAKGTLAMNYLPFATRAGAEIFERCLVTCVGRDGAHWAVHYREPRARFGSQGPERTVTARRVVIAAGSLGSTEILLRSRLRGLQVSPRIGERFTGNGDVLAFAYNNHMPINGIGTGRRASNVGPCITGIIQQRPGSRELEFVIEDGALPSAMAKVLPAALKAGAALSGIRHPESILGGFNRWWRIARSAVSGAYTGAVHHTQTFLVMAHDDSGGRISLDAFGEVRIDWPGLDRLPVWAEIERTIRKCAQATGGQYVENPSWNPLLGSNLITVHPLGGCAMAENGAEGVVDDCGRVFVGHGKAVHETLHVLDGSIIPRSLGINPFLTITALAERAVERVLRGNGR